MGGIPDRDRILRLLAKSGSSSHARLRTELNLTDKKYGNEKGKLLNEGLVKPYQCRGGGIQLTNLGYDAEKSTQSAGKSSVEKEDNLYKPLVEYLEKQAEEDGVTSMSIDTSALRNRGKWQNPDVTQVTIEHYPYLDKREIVVTTYEVKQWDRWDTQVVFEAASHLRFSHYAVVVLEWPNDVQSSLTDPTFKIDEIVRECQRFGVGLSLMKPYYRSFRIHEQLEAPPNTPTLDELEFWLEYVFSRKEQARKHYWKLTGFTDEEE